MSTPTHRIEFRTGPAEDYRPMTPARLYSGTAAEMAAVLSGPLAAPPFSGAGQYRIAPTVAPGPTLARCVATPTHPSPAEMARREFALDDEHADLGPFYAAGIEAERARVAAHLRTLVDEHREAARALNDPAPENLSAALEAAEHIGAGLAMLDLAKELDPKGGA